MSHLPLIFLKTTDAEKARVDCFHDFVMENSLTYHDFPFRAIRTVGTTHVANRPYWCNLYIESNEAVGL